VLRNDIWYPDVTAMEKLAFWRIRTGNHEWHRISSTPLVDNADARVWIPGGVELIAGTLSKCSSTLTFDEAYY
jgi:hypothetical protein